MDQTIKETGAKLPDPPWLPQLEKRLRPHVLFAREYVHKHNHGTPGHINLVAIDALSKMLDAAPARLTTEIALTDLPEFKQIIATAQEQIHTLEAAKNGAYAERNKCLVLVALMAQRLDLKTGIGIDPNAETSEWQSILFIDLPAGQVSWHLHESETHMFYFVGAYGGTWDGHTTDEKYRRVVEPGL